MTSLYVFLHSLRFLPFVEDLIPVYVINFVLLYCFIFFISFKLIAGLVWIQIRKYRNCYLLIIINQIMLQ